MKLLGCVRLYGTLLRLIFVAIRQPDGKIIRKTSFGHGVGKLE